MPLVTFEASTNYAEIDGTKDPYLSSKIDWPQATNINDLAARQGWQNRRGTIFGFARNCRDFTSNFSRDCVEGGFPRHPR